MKILVLGSEGQIGSHLSKYLIDKGHEVNRFDIVNDLQQDLTLIPNRKLDHDIRLADFVFFLAFDVGGSRYLKKYQKTYDFVNNNTLIMANVFGLLKKYNKKFIFTSSQMSNMSHSVYGVSKRIGEFYTNSLEGVVVKLWNVYGIEKDYEKSHVITDFIRKGFEQGDFDMMTDGTEEREFLYAQDCCEALEVIMNSYNDLNHNEHIHITSFKSSSINEVSKIVAELFESIGKKITIRPSKDKDTVQLDKRNEADDFILDWWTPKTSLREGIKNVFEEMKTNYLE